MLSKQEREELLRQVEADLENSQSCATFEEMETLASQIGRQVSRTVMEKMAKTAEDSADFSPSDK